MAESDGSVAHRQGGLGLVILLAGLLVIFIASILVGLSAHDRTEPKESRGYDAARLAGFVVLLRLAMGVILWRSGRMKLLLSAFLAGCGGLVLGVLTRAIWTQISA